MLTVVQVSNEREMFTVTPNLMIGAHSRTDFEKQGEIEVLTAVPISRERERSRCSQPYRFRETGRDRGAHSRTDFEKQGEIEVLTVVPISRERERSRCSQSYLPAYLNTLLVLGRSHKAS